MALFPCRRRLVYIETSAATGQKVRTAVDLLLEAVMRRMEQASDQSTLPGRRGRPAPDVAHMQLTPTDESKCSC